MNEIIAKCGLLCNECKAYKATIANDQSMREEVSKEWSKMYGVNIAPEMINCMTCQSETAQFQYCTVCGVRKCAAGRGLENCGFCADYPCEAITKFFEFAPDNKTRLDQIHASL